MASQAKKFRDNIYFRYEVHSANGELEVKTLTYGQVDLITTNLACELHDKLGKEQVVSVLEDHSVYYPILLYALYKLRVPVQMISIRNTPATVCHLLKQTGSQCFVYGLSYLHVKELVSKEIVGAKCFPVPELDLQVLSNSSLNPKWDQILDQNFTEADIEKIVAIVHSSGTTGTPKIVAWNNQFVMYFLQFLQSTYLKRKQFEFIDDKNDILIGITPSYQMFGTYSNHHCIFSGGSIYFCNKFPPTPKHTIDVMKRENITRLNATPYFINQIMHYIQETGDIQPFQKLKNITSGGAPTPNTINDFYLKNKISVVNMFGSSEAFNLLTSEVSQKSDDISTYFFLEDGDKHTYLEHFDGDRYQLIVKKGSPFLATGVANRENGDYASKDLLVASKTVKNGYDYVGRTDDILVIPIVSCCTVIGEGRPCTAALIELSADAIENYDTDTIKEKVYGIVRKANEISPRHSVILPEMIMVIPHSKHLIATDKGSISRKRSIAYFQTEVDAMYAKFFTENSSKRKNHQVRDHSTIETIVVDALTRVLNPVNPLQKDVSLFKQGLNSLFSIQLQNYLSADIASVPQDFTYEHSTIVSMVDYFTQAISSTETNDTSVTKTFNYQDTTDILDKYLQSASKDLIPAVVTDYSDPNDDREHVVMLTGATGSLGSAILLKLLRNPKVKTVYALVRGNESTDLMGRIADSFKKRGYPESELHEAGRVQALPMNVEEEYLGLSIDIYNKLRSETTMILACAWLLDFNQTVAHYDSECIKGLYNMVKFANKEINPIHFHFISSVSATGAYGIYVPETAMPNNPQVALPMGYGQSKFIVEQLFQYLVEKKNMPCYVHRVGQLCGDSNTGAWNTTEMYPLTLVGGGSYMKKMPDLGITVNWIPVDYAGNAIVDIMMSTATRSPKSADETIFHIVNTKEVSWSSLITSMKKCGMDFEIITPEDWVQEVSKDQNNPCHKLLGSYQKLFTSEQKFLIGWETENTCILAPDIKQAPNVSDMLSIYLESWKKTGFYNP
ncbi:hypothetical protein HPULCUR_000453 [Helicostylum pulchrum]|uniref:Carrier domain-containing protein n=1 Tax=Helicostylum pulchrum TaxID=562976 RepID=A0ABP9XK10_9FUNG